MVDAYEQHIRQQFSHQEAPLADTPDYFKEDLNLLKTNLRLLNTTKDQEHSLTNGQSLKDKDGKRVKFDESIETSIYEEEVLEKAMSPQIPSNTQTYRELEAKKHISSLKFPGPDFFTEAKFEPIKVKSSK